MQQKNVRLLNGYRVVFNPSHPASMKNDNWLGYVYEHILVASESLGRALRPNEVVHHLNGLKHDNTKENLLVLERGQHAKLHAWLDRGAPWSKDRERIGENSGNSEVEDLRYCVCGRQLQRHDQRRFCSPSCFHTASRKTSRPSKEELATLLHTHSFNQIGKRFGVTHGAVKKWAERYGLLTTILSRAAGTPVEGAETSGEVQPS